MQPCVKKKRNNIHVSTLVWTIFSAERNIQIIMRFTLDISSLDHIYKERAAYQK